MFEKQQFIKPVYDLKELPSGSYPALVICGRSNVGKSSFINSLFNRKNLAKTSSTPGKTRSLNFYLIDDLFYLVDLPGIGYAKTGKTESAAIGALISGFLAGYSNIHHIFHLVDSRHKPEKQDVILNKYIIENGHQFSIILTKADKLKQSETAQLKKNAPSWFPENSFNNTLFLYSSIDKTGKKEVTKKIHSIFYSSD